MIAACPRCRTRYRIRPDQLEGDGLRLRCSRCRSVFRVRPPEPRPRPDAETRDAGLPAAAAPAAGAPGRRAGADAPPPSEPHFDRERLVLVAHAEPDACKQLGDRLEALGLQVAVAHDGVEAILTIQRTLPRLVILDAALPKMFGFQICELVKRNESLRSIQVVLVGALHKEERYRRRAPGELYGADAYVEPRELRESLPTLLARFGLETAGDAPPQMSDPVPADPASVAPAPAADLGDPDFPAADEAFQPAPVPEAPPPVDEFGAPGSFGPDEVPAATEVPELELDEPAPETAGPAAAGFELEPPPDADPVADAPPGAAAADAPPEPEAGDPLADERARAERLARIIVSDIVLYNEERFAAAVTEGRVLEAMREDLDEGRSLFDARIDERVRRGRDFLTEEIERVAERRRRA